MTVAAGLTASAAAVGLGWLATESLPCFPPGRGASQHRKNQQTETAGDQRPPIEVTGASMAPTLIGRHIEATCNACGISWAAYGEFTAGPLKKSTVCWNCGAAVSLDTSAVQPGTAVQLIRKAADGAAFEVGSLVAVHWPSGGEYAHHAPAAPAAVGAGDAGNPFALSVKRVVAGPGQRVTHRNGQLLVDGMPILPEQSWIPVHDDSHRRAGESWWQLPPAGDSASVDQTAGGFRLWPGGRDAAPTAEPASGWLVYHHRSVHNHMRPDVIRDDVPGNVTEVRALLPVSRLRLSLQLKGSKAGTLEVAFWQEAAVDVHRLAFSSGSSELQLIGPRFRVTTGSTSELSTAPLPAAMFPELNGQRPIAVRIVTGAAEITQLRIDRPLEYRIDPRLAAKREWPIRLAADEYYLLGDNVPLSIDSRHFGPIGRGRIVGRIEPVRYDEARR